jgi:NmrA-like family
LPSRIANEIKSPGFDTIISCLGRNVIQAQIPLLRWAEHNAPQIIRFYPSEYGTDIEYNAETSPDEKPHQDKLKVRAFIRDNINRLSFTYLVTGPYADMYLWPPRGDPRIGSWDVRARAAMLLGTGEERVSLTTMRDVGRLIVASLHRPKESRNKALVVNSFTTTPNAILAEFEKQTSAKWAVSYTSLEELKKIERDMWQKGVPQATGATLRRIWTEGGTLYDERDNEAIGAPESETLEIAVKRQIQEQEGGTSLIPGL